MHRPQTLIAIYFHKLNLGACLFHCDQIKMQCSQIRSLCCTAYPVIRDKLAQCEYILTNNSTHQLFKHIDSQSRQIIDVSDKSLDRESIEMNLSSISQHMASTNLKAYLQLYANSHAKYYSLGMMLNYLLRQQDNVLLREKIFIEDIEYFIDSLFQVVQIDKTTMQFLEISKQDVHPSIIKGKGASKQGYSLLSAYESFLLTTGSKKILRYIFMNPTYNASLLHQRWQVIGWMKLHLSDTAKYQQHFRNVHNIEAILSKFNKNHPQDQSEWKKLIRTLQAMLELRRLLTLTDIPSIVSQFVNHQSWEEIISIFDIFRNTVDFDPLAIKHGVDGTLDQLKKTYDNMPHMLTLIARQQQWQLDFRIVFMTQVGYLIKLNSDMELPSHFDSQDWVLQFSNSSGKYYSNNLTHLLDSQYGDVYGEIQDIEKKIIFDLQTMIVEREDTLVELYWKLCQIQCYWGVSQLSKSMCQPRLSSQALIASNGWHMLLAGDAIHNHSFSFCQTQAPINYIYNSEQNLVNTNYSNRCTIITGPNASGKTVYMKQLGLIVYLAHLGFYVPASFAQIPLCDSIRFIGKAQSIFNDQKCGLQGQLKSLCSIAQTSIMLRYADVISNKTLILIDQIGAQIDYQNSLKLLYAIVDYLTNKEVKFLNNKVLSKKSDQFTVPMTIIVTHLSQILRGSILEQNYLVRFLTMSVQQCGLRLFKIKPGLVAKGYGIKTAVQTLPPSVISASQKFMRLISKL